MTDLQVLTRDIVAKCLPGALIRESDRELFRANRDFLLGCEDDIVTTFYDTAYAHPPTAAVFHAGERDDREQTLREWWRDTVTGDLGEEYLQRMALVGIVHVRRGVKNPMMLSMFQVIRDVVSKNAVVQLDLERALPLGIAISHFQVTVGTVIAEAYTQGYIRGLQNIAGLRPELTARMLDIEIKQMEADARVAL